MDATRTATAQGTNAPAMVAHIKDQAAALVIRVNSGIDTTTDAFTAKAAEVADLLTRRLCQNLIALGRADLARLISIAWNQAA